MDVSVVYKDPFIKCFSIQVSTTKPKEGMVIDVSQTLVPKIILLNVPIYDYVLTDIVIYS